MYLQDLEEIYPNLTYDLTTICLQGFQWAEPDECLTELIYHEYYAPILHLQFPNSHLYLTKEHIHPKIDALLRTIITTHFPWMKTSLAAQHYASLADQFLYNSSWVGRYVLETTFVFYSCVDQCLESFVCSSEDIFNSSDDEDKEIHSQTLSNIAYVAHVLPLACGSKYVREKIFDLHIFPEKNFHGKWHLNGWNDNIIGPARDAVLEYYKVRAYATLKDRASLICVQRNSILRDMQIARR